MKMTRIHYLLLTLGLAFCTGISSAQVQTGMPPFGSFGGGPDIINLANLNVHLTIPVLHKTGRGTDFTYDLSNDSSVWYPVGASGSQTWQPVTNFGWRGQTEVLLGYVSATVTQVSSCSGQGSVYTASNWVYHDNFGAPHRFLGTTQSQRGSLNCPRSDTSLTALAQDGSGYTLNATGAFSLTANITSSSGAVTNPPINTTGGSASYTDRNGNVLSVNTSGQFTDTLSTTALTVTGTGTSTDPTLFKYTAPSGAVAQYTMNYTNYTVATNFAVSGITEYKSTAAVPLVSSIVLPDNSQYTFTYEATPSIPSSGACTPYAGTTCVTARITKITLPTGASLTYSYSGGAGTNGSGILADGSAATLTRAIPDGTWTYAQVKGSGAASTTTITAPKLPYDPASNQTVTQFQGIYETQRVVYQGSTAVLQTINTCYNGAASPCTGTAITLPITTRSITNQLGTSGLIAKQVFTYNNFGLVTEEDDYDFPSGTSLLKKTLTTFASLGNNINAFPHQVTVCNGAGTSCNGSGTPISVTTYNYDETAVTATSGTPQLVAVSGARGNLTSINYPVSGLNAYFTYYDTGTINTAKDVNGAVTTYSYAGSSCGNSFPTGVSEPPSLSRSMTWDCTGGVQLTATDENGQPTKTTYSDQYFWRPTSITDPTSAVTNFCYGVVTNGTCTINPNQVESTLTFNSNNSAVDTLTTLDGLGRIQLRQTRQAPSSSNFDTVETDYDAAGRSSRVTLPYVGTAGQTNSSAPATTANYDPLSRPSLITDAGGGSASYAYPQNDITVTIGPAPTGENAKSRQLEHDALGRLTSVCEISTASGSGACGQNSAQTGFWTTYAYAFDSQAHPLLKVTQNAQAPAGGQQVRSYTYDAMNRLISEINAESGTTTNAFDSDSTCGTSNGDQVKRVDAVGNTTCIAYDALHRVTSVTYSGPYASNTPNKYRVYDSAVVNGVAMVNVKNRLAEAYTATSQTGTKITDEGFSYSTRGELTDIYQLTPHSGSYYHVSQTYWPHGAPFQLSGNIGLPTIQYGGTIGSTVGLDGEARITQVSASSGQNPVTGVSFNGASLPTQMNFGSGDSDIFAYDPYTLRMSQYQFKVNGQSDTGTLTWNANSTLQKLTIADAFNSTNNQTCNYGYDDIMRLTGANCAAAAAQTFSYDAFGNINKSGSPYGFQPTYSSATNRMTSLPGNFTPTYDNNGNVTNDSNHTYAWDADGNSVTIDGVGLTFDALDRAVEKNISGSYTQIVYAPTGGKLALMSGQTLQKAFVPLPGHATAVYTSTGLSNYRHSDWQGSARLSSTNTSGSPGTGSATVGGSEQTIPGSAATSGTGSVTITGSERSTRSCPCPNGCSLQPSCWTTIYDSGTVSITVNGFTKSTSYGQSSTASSLASALASAFNGDSTSPVTAGVSGATVTLTTKQAGASTNYAFSASSATTTTTWFTGTSFPVSTSGSTLTGGKDATPTVYDTGNTWVSINGTQYSATYGQGSSSATVASALATAISAGTLANATASGSGITITAKATGASTNYSLSGGSSTNLPGTFANPSFTVSVSGAALTGGTNGGTAMYADTAYAPFGEPYAQAGASDLSFTGQNQDTVGGVYDFLAREYSIQGRWASPDPAGLAAVDPSNPQSWNRYAYVLNNPLALVDPFGLSCVPLDNGTEGDNGDGLGCPASGVASGDPNNPNNITPQQVNVTANPDSFLSFIFSPTVPIYVPNDVPLNQNAQIILPLAAAEAEHAMGCVAIPGAGLLAGGTAFQLGQPIAGSKPFVTPGSSTGTSTASEALRDALPQKLPFRVPTPVGGPGTGTPLRMVATNKLGAAAGRYVPFVGAAVTAYSAYKMNQCLNSKP